MAWIALVGVGGAPAYCWTDKTATSVSWGVIGMPEGLAIVRAIFAGPLLGDRGEG